MNQCHHCGNPVRQNARFCPKCGSPAIQQVQPTLRTNQCSHCHAQVRDGVRFCASCGQSVQSLQSQEPTRIVSPPPYMPPQYVPPVPQFPAAPPAAPSGSETHSRAYMIRHLVIATVLLLGLAAALTGVYLWDEPETTAATPEELVVPTPIPPTPPPALAYPDPVVAMGHMADGRFGLTTTIGNPDRDDDDEKQLTFASAGETNNTRIYVDGDTPLFGGEDGRFQQQPRMNRDGDELTAVWLYNGILITQEVTIVESSSSHLLDTLRIAYTIENQDDQPHEVGLRLMLDTLIGENDGVPFVVPGRDGITDRAVDLRGTAVPDFIQALENEDLVNPGVIVNMTLKGGEAVPPDRVVISGWYDENAEWDILSPVGGEGTPLRRGGRRTSTPDSAVGIYYDPVTMNPGDTRSLVTFYGMGGISSMETGNPALSLTFNREVSEGDEFWVVAVVVNPVDGQTLELDLPPELELGEGETAVKPVTVTSDEYYTQISWLVKAETPVDSANIRVTLDPDDITETQSITVSGQGITR